MTFDNNSKAKPWRTHYSILLHVGFPWNHDDLPNEPAVNSTPIFITEEMICNTISQMKREKKLLAVLESHLEMILASQEHIIPHLTKLANNIVTEGKIPED